LGDVWKLSDEELTKRLGKFGHRLSELSRNVDRSVVSPVSVAKSISSETTLTENTRDRALLKQHLLEQSESVGRQLRKAGMRARTVTLKLKHGDFKRATRSTTLRGPTQSSDTIYKAAVGLLRSYTIERPLRLIGVGTSGLTPDDAPRQMPLFADGENPDKGWERVDAAIDAIGRKYGRDAVRKATLRDP